MLTDHRVEQERWARQRRNQRLLARSFGRLIAALARWDWFVTITFGARTLCEVACARIELRRDGGVASCTPDPQLANYQPCSRYYPSVSSLAPAVALRRIEQWLTELQQRVGSPIGWLVAKEFGRLGGRWHCHVLVTGVARLYRGSSGEKLIGDSATRESIPGSSALALTATAGD
jgi:hypothetical protein